MRSPGRSPEPSEPVSLQWRCQEARTLKDTSPCPSSLKPWSPNPMPPSWWAPYPTAFKLWPPNPTSRGRMTPTPCPSSPYPQSPHPRGGGPPVPCPRPPVPLPQEPGSGSSRFPARWLRGQGCAQHPFQGHKQTKGPWDHRPGITHPLGSQGRDGAGLTPESQRIYRQSREKPPPGWPWVLGVGGHNGDNHRARVPCARGAHHHQPGSHHFIGFHCYSDLFYGNIQNTKEKKKKTKPTNSQERLSPRDTIS